jgi:ribosomal protein L21E
MNKIELCEKIKSSIRKIIVDNGEKIISAGTGVVVDANGSILTAKHVIASNGKFYPGKLVVQSASGDKDIEYVCVSDPNYAIDINQPSLMHPFTIDLALLKPKYKLQTVFLEMQEEVAQIGTDVILAGFPDDVGMPMNFDEYLNLMNPDMTDIKKSIDKKFSYYLRQPLFKSSMIGSVSKINIVADNIGIKIDGASYITDTDLTYGGSGGPIVSMGGKLLGVIIRKGFTDAKKSMIQHLSQNVLPRLPSGIGFGLSHHLITKVYL